MRNPAEFAQTRHQALVWLETNGYGQLVVVSFSAEETKRLNKFLLGVKRAGWRRLKRLANRQRKAEQRARRTR